ncbi:MAG: hypothetical protein VX294_09740 [Candidatus Latescibacterota bacterium]|nr:hypothetical protein [Candidatus Latescibacterota bacterium]
MNNLKILIAFCLINEALYSESIDNRLTVSLAYTSQIDSTRIWPHMQQFHRTNIQYMHARTDSELRSLGIYNVTSNIVELNSQGVTNFTDDVTAEYIAHFVVKSFNRLYRNRTIYLRDPGYAPLTQRQEEALPRQIKSLPALTTAVEIRLIDTTRKKTIWSELLDSTILLPHRERFVLNPDKYPGYTDPKFIKKFTAPILRQRFKNPSTYRMLTVADRWYLSSPQDDISYARNLTQAIASAAVPKILAQLPLSGRIVSIQQPDAQKRRQFIINLGGQHGMREGLRLDVYREKRKLVKIGQIKIVATGPTTSLAREHKVERNARENGVILSIGDSVVSDKRP